jgi:uncharacterized membrane protein YhaH (DUF805 family)
MDFHKMTKQQLKEYGETIGVKLNLKNKKDVLIEELNRSAEQEEQKQPIEKKTYVPQPPLSFNESVGTCFRKYFDFSGRARGSEYWYFFLFSFLVGWIAVFLDTGLFGTAFEDYGPLNMITSVGLFIPSISAASRRLHDSGKSGWWQLLYLTVIGVFLLLYWLIRKGDDNENSYNSN